jgi:hypothetical protein
MTPAQHPLRCETCNKATSEILENGAIRCKGNYLSPDYVRFISEMGCASHSASSDVLEELEKRVWYMGQGEREFLHKEVEKLKEELRQ